MDQSQFHSAHPTHSPYNPYEKIKRLLDFEHGQKLKILDVGCGDGSLGNLLQSFGHSVTGLDMQSGAADHFARIIGDINGAWPVTSGNFDVIICTDVAEHLYDPAHILLES